MMMIMNAVAYRWFRVNVCHITSFPCQTKTKEYYVNNEIPFKF